MDYDSIFEKLGFYKSGKCSCGGTLNIKYRNKDGYTWYIQPKKERFKLKWKAEERIPLTPLTDIHKHLNEFSTKIPA